MPHQRARLDPSGFRATSGPTRYTYSPYMSRIPVIDAETNGRTGASFYAWGGADNRFSHIVGKQGALLQRLVWFLILHDTRDLALARIEEVVGTGFTQLPALEQAISSCLSLENIKGFVR